jgi:hypothetical protein
MALSRTEKGDHRSVRPSLIELIKDIDKFGKQSHRIFILFLSFKCRILSISFSDFISHLF